LLPNEVSFYYFRNSYEQALNTQDYILISIYLLSGSLAEEELVEYIEDLQDKNYSYAFKDNMILNSQKAEEVIIKMTSNENYIFINHLGEQTTYNRDYGVLIDLRFNGSEVNVLLDLFIITGAKGPVPMLILKQ
jgi:hypothetical protein